MCGIAGFIRLKNFEVDDQARFENYMESAIVGLSMASTKRGKDAAGFAFVHKDEHGTFSLKHYKQKGSADTPEFKTKILEYLYKYGIPEVMIMHTRAQTQGSADKNENNHPIISMDDVMALVHNGMVSNDDDIKKALKSPIESSADVDSEAILRLIEQNLPDAKVEPNQLYNAVKDSTKEIAGSFTCALISAEFPEQLILFTHTNPLNLCADKKNGVLWFASTDEILKNSVKSGDFVWDLLFDSESTNYVTNDVESDVLLCISQRDSTGFDMSKCKIITKTDYSSYNSHSVHNQYGGQYWGD